MKTNSAFTEILVYCSSHDGYQCTQVLFPVIFQRIGFKLIHVSNLEDYVGGSHLLLSPYSILFYYYLYMGFYVAFKYSIPRRGCYPSFVVLSATHIILTLPGMSWKDNSSESLTVTHPSTIPARLCLTSEIERELVHWQLVLARHN